MRRRLTLLATVLLLSALADCTADLADSNPCHAIARALCEESSRCNQLAPGTTVAQCVDDWANAGYVNSCVVSPAAARSCAADLDAVACKAPGVPSSCVNIGFNAMGYYDGDSPEGDMPNPFVGSSAGGNGAGSGSQGGNTGVAAGSGAAGRSGGVAGSKGAAGSGSGGASSSGSGMCSGSGSNSTSGFGAPCQPLLAAMMSASIVMTKGSCGSTTGVGFTLPDYGWVDRDPNSGSCISDGYIAEAINECFAAECECYWSLPSEAPDHLATAKMYLDDAQQLCGGTSFGNGTCAFEQLWQCK